MIKQELNKIKEQLGWQGTYGVGLLVLAAAFNWFALKPLEDKTSFTRSRMDMARSYPGSGKIANPGNRQSELGAFFASLPNENEVTDTLAVIYVTAEKCGLAFKEASYHLEDKDRPRIEYVVDFPVTGEYANIRLFISSVLAKHPALALDQIDFQRDRVSDTALKANIRLTLFLRPFK